MNSSPVTQARLKEVLDYDPDTGVFVWKVATARRVKVGDIAGCFCKTSGYVLISIDCSRYRAHRLAWLYTTGSWPSEHVDHIKHDRADNRWEKIREASHRENHKNQSLSKNNTSGRIGVAWSSACKKWRAYITIDYKQKHLGVFDCKLAATIIRVAAEREHGFHLNHGQ